ncbi:unnamed protein product [Phaedon cochleariae]|uniref:Uncharacterized protein n=1 Tax=Phaedon cochleariae TaxID=80249 RepID=A0A9N9X6H5_PHACE|nr:unnamed protein product [Phaedon cochleariae]
MSGNRRLSDQLGNSIKTDVATYSTYRLMVAMKIMQTLYNEQLIRHSGDKNVEFLYGFYLFYIVISEKDDKDACQLNMDHQIFENEWMEVEVKPALNWGLNISPSFLQIPNSLSDRGQGIPHFLCEDIDPEYSDCDLDEQRPDKKTLLYHEEELIRRGCTVQLQRNGLLIDGVKFNISDLNSNFSSQLNVEEVNQYLMYGTFQKSPQTSNPPDHQSQIDIATSNLPDYPSQI